MVIMFISKSLTVQVNNFVVYKINIGGLKMLEPNKKEWETPEFKELETTEQLIKQTLDSFNKSVKELHGIYQELHEINKILKRKS